MSLVLNRNLHEKGVILLLISKTLILSRTTWEPVFIELSQPQQKKGVLNMHRKGVSNRKFNNSDDKLENFQKI